MGNIRRWYIYGICAIALQALTWAVISLLRNLILSPLQPEPEALAFQIAVIVVGGQNSGNINTIIARMTSVNNPPTLK